MPPGFGGEEFAEVRRRRCLPGKLFRVDDPAEGGRSDERLKLRQLGGISLSQCVQLRATQLTEFLVARVYAAVGDLGWVDGANKDDGEPQFQEAFARVEILHRDACGLRIALQTDRYAHIRQYVLQFQVMPARIGSEKRQ